MDANLFFYTAFILMLIHEMDAVRRHEWRVFPLLARIKDDERGYLLFSAIHIPLYLALFFALFPGEGGVNHSATDGFAIFCIVHVALHLLFSKHPAYEFNNWYSWMLILGAGIAGAIDLAVR